MNLEGRTARASGASSGIGEQFAHQLAAKEPSLVITARRVDRLEALAAKLREDHGVEVTVLDSDLAQSTAPLELWQKTEGQDQRIDILIGNAGLGTTLVRLCGSR